MLSLARVFPFLVYLVALSVHRSLLPSSKFEIGGSVKFCMCLSVVSCFVNIYCLWVAYTELRYCRVDRVKDEST